MKYDLSARLMPFLFDRYAYSFLKEKGLSSIKKKAVHKEYKAMLKRTPDLPSDNSFIGNLLVGSYVLSFYKAYPELISEEIFQELVAVLCTCKPIIKAHEKEDPFDEKTLKQKEKDAIKSQNSTYEMDWCFTYRKNDEDSYDITYTRCGLCQLGKREDCFHLIRYLCEADFITYSLMGVELVRKETLANGNEKCDFHIRRKKKE